MKTVWMNTNYDQDGGEDGGQTRGSQVLSPLIVLMTMMNLSVVVIDL